MNSFDSYANALALQLLRKKGWTENHAFPEFAHHKVIGGADGGLILIKADGLSNDDIKNITDLCFKSLKNKVFPKAWQIVSVLFVFEMSECPLKLRKFILKQKRTDMFSVSTLKQALPGVVDLVSLEVVFKDGGLGSGTPTRLFLKKVAEDLKTGITVSEADYQAVAREEDVRSQALNKQLAATTPWGTWAIAATCIFVFICATISGGTFYTPVLLRFGAASGPLLMKGEWWRLFGATFLHIGILHIILNMYALLIIGSNMERFYGNMRFLALYAVSGLGGSLASDLLSGKVSAGASGAIFGLFGATVYLGYFYSGSLPASIRVAMKRSIPTILYNLIYGFSRTGIDNYAHIGGFLSGLLFAAVCPLLVNVESKNNSLSRTSKLGVVPTVLIFALAAAPFATEGYVMYRAAQFKGYLDGPYVTYQDPAGRYSMRYPLSMIITEKEKDRLFRLPGVEIWVSFIDLETQNLFQKETQDAFLRLLKELKKELKIDIVRNEVLEIEGRKYLNLEGTTMRNAAPMLLHKFVFIGDGQKCLRLYLRCDQGMACEDGKSVLQEMMKSLQIQQTVTAIGSKQIDPQHNDAPRQSAREEIPYASRALEKRGDLELAEPYAEKLAMPRKDLKSAIKDPSEKKSN